MAFVHGHVGYIAIDDSGGSPHDISAYVTNVEGFPGDAASHDVTTYSKATVARNAGLKDCKPVLTGVYDPTVDGWLAGALGVIGTVTYGPSGSTAGYQKYTGEFLLVSYKVSEPVGAMAVWTANYEIASGDLSDTTF